MEKIRIKNLGIFIILFFAGFFQGCENLNEDSAGLISADSFYADEVSLKSGVVGVHRKFAEIFYWPGICIPTTGDDILTTIEGSNKQPYRDYDQFKASGTQEWEHSQAWYPCYIAVRAANSFIESVEKNIDIIKADKSIINQRLGEIRYMRANTYFQITRIWGDIPYFETTAMQDSSTQKLSKRIVYDRIIKDLEFAEQNCVENKEAPGQVTKWAAKACLAQVYMQLTGWPFNETDKWPKVKQYCQDIINSGKFELMPNYGDLYKYTKFSKNKEDIFSLTFGLAATGTWQRYFGKPFNDWNDLHCQWKFYYDFPEGDRKSFSLQANLKMGPYKNFVHPCFSKFLFGTIKFDPQGKNDKEYIDAYEHTWQTSNNIALERYANIYLMWAEADASVTNSISAQAVEYLNKVKRRAKGDINLVGGNYYNSQMTGVDIAVSDFSNVSQFKKAIIAERGWEFAGDFGYRWFDLVRNDMLKEVTSLRNKYDLDESIKAALNDWKSKNPAATQSQIDSQIKIFKTLATEITLNDLNPTNEKFGFAPIPQLVIQTTPGMKKPALTSFQ